MAFEALKKVLIKDLLAVTIISIAFALPSAFLIRYSGIEPRETGHARIELKNGKIIETRTSEEKAKVLRENRGTIRGMTIDTELKEDSVLSFAFKYSFLLFALLTCWVLIVERKQLFQWLKPTWRFVLLGLGGGGAAFLITSGAGYCLSFFGFSDNQWGWLGRLDVSHQWLFFFLAVVLAPIGEEVYFRGRLMGAMEKDWGKNWSLWVSSGLFAGMHFSVIALPIYFFFGWVLGSLRQRSGSLVPSILCHAVNNGLAVGFLFLS